VLTIHYGDMENVIYNTSVYFDNVYSPQWFQDSFAQRVIKSIDKGTVVGPNAIDTKILGIIPPEKLSSGTKTLLLMYFMPQNIYNASNCGDNCAYWILRIAAQKGSNNQSLPHNGFWKRQIHGNHCKYGRYSPHNV
jgi:hypothetical protein